jgi:hypothetical protein
VSRWAGFVAPSLEHPALDGLWAKVEADWENDAAHARFLDQAAVLGTLDIAAARYRQRLKKDADPRAQAALDRAVRLALEIQGVQAPDPGLSKLARLIKFTGILIAVGLFVATLWVVWATLGRR